MLHRLLLSVQAPGPHTMLQILCLFEQHLLHKFMQDGVQLRFIELLVYFTLRNSHRASDIIAPCTVGESRQLERGSEVGHFCR